MQAGETVPSRSVNDAEAHIASTSSEVDVDLTPPKKRIKSAQASRRASVERSLNDAEAEREANGFVASLPDGTMTVKEEHDTGERASMLEDPTPQTLATSVKKEASLPDVSPSSATATSPPSAQLEPSMQPAAKKKKLSSSTITSTKKENSTSSSSSNKPKKSASSSSKKATSSASPSTHHEPSTHRSGSKAKVELLSPPPTTSSTNTSMNYSSAKTVDDDEEEEDNALYCICQRRQDDVEGGMIMCDRCEQWYHYRCMGITEDDAELVDQFICPPCHEVTGESTTYKQACARDGCRRAAVKPFSRFCSDRCGVLAVTARLQALKVEKNKVAVTNFEGDRRVGFASKTEGLTERTEVFEGVWKELIAAKMGGGSEGRLGLAGSFALMVKEDNEEAASQSQNGVSSSTPVPSIINGTTLKPSPSPSPAPATTSHALPTSPSTHLPSTFAEKSSATSIIGINEQLTIIQSELFAVDLEKLRLNTRLDRLDLRSTLLHLVSDRVPTLPPVGSSSSSNETHDAVEADEDEEMQDVSTPKSTTTKKKKASSKSKAKSSIDTSGPRCGYDSRLHWDDVQFDAWASTQPGSDILSYALPLDGQLDDSTPETQTEENGTETETKRVICGTAKRKCKRHMDWSNLCEIALDAEKAALNVDSRVLTQKRLRSAEQLARLQEERRAILDLHDVEEKRERRRREERDREMALQVANQGTRRG